MPSSGSSQYCTFPLFPADDMARLSCKPWSVTELMNQRSSFTTFQLGFNTTAVPSLIRTVSLLDKGCEREPGCFTDIAEAKHALHSWDKQKYLPFEMIHITLCSTSNRFLNREGPTFFFFLSSMKICPAQQLTLNAYITMHL